MSKQGFYLDNMFRTYPFIDPDTGIGLPKSTIVDFNCFIYTEVGYKEDTNKVWLYSVERYGDNFIFKFACDAEGLDGIYLTFLKTLSDPELSYAFSGSLGEYSSSSIPINYNDENETPVGCPEKILWEGYLVIGNLTDLASTMNSGDILYDYTGAGTVIEPTLVINIQDSTIRTINLANRLPLRTTAPEGCTQGYVTTWPESVVVYNSCMTGDITFKHGYSCNVSMLASSNEINFTAVAEGSIAGQNCDIIPGIYVGAGHAVPPGSVLYTGGPLCSDTVKSINGVSAKRLWIVGGKGISLTTDPGTFTINIAATLSGLAVCSNSELYLSSAILD